MSDIEVLPFDITKTITKAQIMTATINLGNSASFIVYLKDVDGSFITSKTVTMSTDDYNKWGLDDTYAQNFVLTSLGLTPNPNPIISNLTISKQQNNSLLSKIGFGF